MLEFYGIIKSRKKVSIMSEKKEKQYVSDNAQLMSEWNWEKNNALGIDSHILTQGSHTKAWWICPNGYSYDAQMFNRAKGNGCSYCAEKSINQ